ncbi:hypothetical protein Vadar_001603 [Vaccinium darrowii]|uniref:Uncharacterized protein n=1 Tax=Vaccinium darrowii TaxID=229202 RepID=A0ACB7XMH9_9ERIC|nr:hypothetical protein Vadar_001603 [Vaccinium darrowii]
MEEMESLVGKLNPSPVAPEDAPLEFSVRNNAPESPQKPKAISVPGLSDLVFEAKSSKDGAWCDVAMFLHHRFLPIGEFEVRVRFAGFGKEDDEWVNVERAVRDRSIPLEPSECDRIEVGDLVLCFRDTDDEATYYDAHIVKIQRKKHDSKCCRCIFVVRYDHDGVKVCPIPNAKILGKSAVGRTAFQAKMMDILALLDPRASFAQYC